ncbi:MAG: hypothetical protein AAFY72_12245, partial [Cyanobacteria bacterium J06649_4]
LCLGSCADISPNIDGKVSQDDLATPVPVERVLVQRSPSEIAENAEAAVIAVDVTGGPGAYNFSVTVESLDTGCDRYANWWEVITEDGDLLYRRILAHSHVEEQPFTRSGGPVDIGVDDVVIVRSHMHPTGYQAQSYQGSVANGFEAISLPAEFAQDLRETEPLPSGCTF